MFDAKAGNPQVRDCGARIIVYGLAWASEDVVCPDGRDCQTRFSQPLILRRRGRCGKTAHRNLCAGASANCLPYRDDAPVHAVLSAEV